MPSSCWPAVKTASLAHTSKMAFRNNSSSLLLHPNHPTSGWLLRAITAPLCWSLCKGNRNQCVRRNTSKEGIGSVPPDHGRETVRGSELGRSFNNAVFHFLRHNVQLWVGAADPAKRGEKIWALKQEDGALKEATLPVVLIHVRDLPHLLLQSKPKTFHFPVKAVATWEIICNRENLSNSCLMIQWLVGLITIGHSQGQFGNNFGPSTFWVHASSHR